jgi:DNA-directed RNA polymerase subunit beta
MERYCIVKYLIELINAKQILMILITYQTVVRTVGEQLSQQFGVGLAMARTIRERMNVRDNEVFTPIDLINAKTLSCYQLFLWNKPMSQFMDQTNPLAEITHKKIICARTRWTFERELDLRYVMFTIRTTDVYVLLKHQRDQTLV